MKWGQGLAVGLMGAVLGGGAMLVAAPVSVSAPERSKIESVIRDYILRNPEIIQEAALKLQSREIGKLVSANRAAFETPYKNAFAGNPRGDVTLVEFFDYACGYCRQSVAVIDRLLAEDRNLRVVYREFPVLGSDSEAAARTSLAAAAVSPAKYNAVHHALFAAGRPDPATLARVAAAQRVSTTGTPEIEAELGANAQLAAAVSVRGTPAFIVGDEVFPGAVTYETLKQAIADARAARK
jgi:protein-disulfide isomerase